MATTSSVPDGQAARAPSTADSTAGRDHHLRLDEQAQELKAEARDRLDARLAAPVGRVDERSKVQRKPRAESRAVVLADQSQPKRRIEGSHAHLGRDAEHEVVEHDQRRHHPGDEGRPGEPWRPVHMDVLSIAERPRRLVRIHQASGARAHRDMEFSGPAVEGTGRRPHTQGDAAVVAVAGPPTRMARTNSTGVPGAAYRPRRTWSRRPSATAVRMPRWDQPSACSSSLVQNRLCTARSVAASEASPLGVRARVTCAPRSRRWGGADATHDLVQTEDCVAHGGRRSGSGPPPASGSSVAVGRRRGATRS
jgi:hypothetical protein